MSQLSYPWLNGAMPDFFSMDLNISNVPGVVLPSIAYVESVDYSDELSARFFHLTSTQPVARSRGSYMARGQITIGLEESRVLLGYLSQYGGYGDGRFDIILNYAATQGSMVTDGLYGCRIVSSSQQQSQDGKGLVTRYGLSITQILWNGHALAAPMPTS